MNRPNVVGLRRLLTSMKDTSRAHAAVLASLPLVSARRESIQLELQLGSDRAAGGKRIGQVSRTKEPI
jgi:hypothetical protein